MTQQPTNTVLRTMTLTAIFAAFICIAAPWAVPIGPVPVSLGTFALYVASVSLGSKRGSIAVAIYLMLGFMGMPVFTGFAGGIQRLLGPTGGYLVGYIPCAAIAGVFPDKFKKLWSYPVGMVLGTVVLYAFGTAWYCLMSGSTLVPAVMACVVPFLPGDAVKIACATGISAKLRPIADRFG